MLRLKDLAEGRTPKKDYHFEAKRWIRNTQKECSYDKSDWTAEKEIYFKTYGPEALRERLQQNNTSHKQ